MKRINDKVRLLRVAAANARSKLAEAVYLKTGMDFTRPVQIYALPTLRCNARCVMCDFWSRDSERSEELPAEVWIRALRSLRRFVGPYHVQFSAAEPLIKEDIFEILSDCSNSGISTGITTNGLLLTPANARKLIDCRVFNVNVSIDSLDPAVHDRIRGVPGMLARVRANVEHLAELRKASGRPRLIIRPLICAETLGGLEDLVRYAADLGATAVNPQPVAGPTEEIHRMQAVDEALLIRTVDRLIEMKRGGYPIMNSEPAIRRWVDFFRNPEAPKVSSPREGRCVVALRNLTILTNGDVTTCDLLDSVLGNIATADVARMWQSDRAKQLRKSLTRCRRLCTATCVEKRRWRDYLALMRKLAG